MGKEKHWAERFQTRTKNEEQPLQIEAFTSADKNEA